MIKTGLILLAIAVPGAATAVMPEGLGAVWGALSASPGLLAVVIVLILNHRSEERREAIRQSGEADRQASKQKHENAMAERYEKLIKEIEADRRENLTGMRELVRDIRTSHTAMFSRDKP
jgi:signal transduction histidine kinase